MNAQRVFRWVTLSSLSPIFVVFSLIDNQAKSLPFVNELSA